MFRVLRMYNFAAKVDGSEKAQNYADVTYGWSLISTTIFLEEMPADFRK